jgi:hypothetical protein
LPRIIVRPLPPLPLFGEGNKNKERVRKKRIVK